MSPSAIPIETTSCLTDKGVSHTLKKAVANQSPLADLNASLCMTALTQNPRTVPEPNSPEVFAQKTCTDHMITCSWTHTEGWKAPELKPYGPLTLMPTASVLHYATECFEGLKLYRGYGGKLRLFRPQRNCARMLTSSTRIALPGFKPEELLKLIVKLCATDGEKWLPKSRPGTFLYIRPTMIGNDSALGVQKPKEALLYIILACFPNLDISQGPKPGLKLLASRDDMVRAWPGGFGYAKVGANYGPSLLAQGEARAKGYDQILWLFGQDCEVTEAGASNFFVVWRTREGKLQLVTAPLGEKIILDGVTRRSAIDLAQSRLSGKVSNGHSNGHAESELEPLEVVERHFNMGEVLDASNEGRLVEAFAAGTAFFIAAISEIHFRGKDIEVPLKGGDMGLYAGKIKGWLKDIMYGNEQHEWGLVVDEE